MYLDFIKYTYEPLKIANATVIIFLVLDNIKTVNSD